MKKQYKTIAVCIAVIAVLLGRAMVYFVKEYRKDFPYDIEFSVDVPEKKEVGENGTKIRNET